MQFIGFHRHMCCFSLEILVRMLVVVSQMIICGWKCVEGVCNEACERFFGYSTINKFTIPNTWFAKKAIHPTMWKQSDHA